MQILDHYFLLYVDSPATSANFYSRLLDKPPVALNPTFALFMLNNGVKLGLWSRHAAEPSAQATGGGCEVGFRVAEPSTVDELHAHWVNQGVNIAQSPVEMDFGYTFTALDPDGHRLRVFTVPQ
ncbi:VOC family protein [Pseudomonas yamanorum]|nr:VOC family protein [Pseudomonas yamanorum]